MAAPTRVRGRFVRSVRLDAASAGDLDGYLPTARALDVIRRFIRGMADDAGTRAFSITGPYGSGKSSLAVFIESLCGPEASDAYRRAAALLAEYDPDTAAALPAARAAMGVPSSGMALAVITAPQREPVTTTVLRALRAGVATEASNQQLAREVDSALERAHDDKLASPSFHEVRDLIAGITERRPLLLVIDEFGKNLEAYSESGADGDLYLLQELAEWSTNAKQRLPMVVVTIQHLAFEAYAGADSASKRREWAKVQGRFEDIPFVESSAATRNLIAAALDHGQDPDFAESRRRAAAEVAAAAANSGLPEVAPSEIVQATWPLHPTVMQVLPELCARYGQNERTLFSFLASPEPLSVNSWLAQVGSKPPLPWVRLDRVYDYFVESAGNFLLLSEEGSRWTEIATSIRDAHGLDEAQQRVLKAVGTLNLVASTGALRASTPLIALACADGEQGTAETAEVAARLSELVDLGLITFRDYAQEYRIWRGSDFDINGALQIARRGASQTSLAHLLSRIRPMRPVVAARHSTCTGTLRAFSQTYADAQLATISQPPPASVCDGVVVHRLDDTEITLVDDNGSPVLVVDAGDPSAVRNAAIEVAALSDVAHDPALRADDHAARREIAERLAHARLRLDTRIADAFGAEARRTWINPPPRHGGTPREVAGPGALSDALDAAFDQGPERVAYEAINRSELTSSGARARRVLQAALVDPEKARKPRLGLEGAGPEVAIYQAVIADAGIHKDGELGPPSETSDWRPVWDAVLKELDGEDARVSVEHLEDTMMAVPFGLRRGTASLLLTALLVVEAKDLAIYEHGTFQPHLSAPVAERLVRNPGNFSVKHLGTAKRGSRWSALKALNSALDSLNLGAPLESVTVLGTVRRIVGIYQRANSRYVNKTREFVGSARSPEAAERAGHVRDALIKAREPDVLLFTELPSALDMDPFNGDDSRISPHKIDTYAREVALALYTISRALAELAQSIFDRVSAAAVPLGANGEPLDEMQRMKALEGSATALASVETLPPDVRSFVQACLMNPSTPGQLGTQIATTVTGGSPGDWTDRDVPRNLSRLEDTARAFRRMADLARARAAFDEGESAFRAYAVTMTAADGQTEDKTVTLTREQQGRVDKALNTAVNELQDLGGRALDALLAGIAARAVDTARLGHSTEDRPNETDHSTEEGTIG